MFELEYMKLRGTAHVPNRAHPADAGLDLATEHRITLGVRQRHLASTGVAVAIPENCVGLVNPRSGLGTKGVTVVNAPGTIDAGYRGEVFVNLINLGDPPVTLDAGQRIAQLLIVPIIIPALRDVDFFTTAGDRGTNGHGSTDHQLPGQLTIDDLEGPANV